MRIMSQLGASSQPRRRSLPYCLLTQATLSESGIRFVIGTTGLCREEYLPPFNAKDLGNPFDLSCRRRAATLENVAKTGEFHT